MEAARNEKIERMIAEMTAAVLYGKEDLRLERVAVPQAGPGRDGCAGGGGADLRNGPEGLSARIPCHDAEAADTVWA